MTHAVCVRCGAMKFGCLTVCKACGEAQRTRRQIAYSYLFSEHHFDHDRLLVWSREAVQDGIPLPPLHPDEEAAFIEHYAARYVDDEVDAPDVLTVHPGQSLVNG